LREVQADFQESGLGNDLHHFAKSSRCSRVWPTFRPQRKRGTCWSDDTRLGTDGKKGRTWVLAVPLRSC
jgi:hypothetical protein